MLNYQGDVIGSILTFVKEYKSQDTLEPYNADVYIIMLSDEYITLRTIV